MEVNGSEHQFAILRCFGHLSSIVPRFIILLLYAFDMLEMLLISDLVSDYYGPHSLARSAQLSDTHVPTFQNIFHIRL